MGVFGQSRISVFGAIQNQLRRGYRKVVPVQSEFPRLVEENLKKLGASRRFHPFTVRKGARKTYGYEIADYAKPPTEDKLAHAFATHINLTKGRPLYRKPLNNPAAMGGPWRFRMERYMKFGQHLFPTLGTHVPLSSAARILQGKKPFVTKTG